MENVLSKFDACCIACHCSFCADVCHQACCTNRIQLSSVSVCVFPYAILLKCMFGRLYRRCVMLSSSSQSCPLTHPGMSLRLSTFHDLARLITVMAPHTRHVSLSLDTRLILYGQNWHTIIISLFSCRSLEDAPCSSCSSESSRSLL